MILARKILFYLFILIYLSLCPFLILYSFGYILNPVNKQISQTGLIHLSTAPPGAHVYLDKSRYKYKTPVSITELLPGSYQVNLKLEGYRPWKHKVFVRAGGSSVFENILLIRQRLKTDRLFSESKYRDLIPIPGKDSFFVRKGSRLGDLYFFDREKEKLIPVATEDSPYYGIPLISISQQMGSMTFIAHCGSLWERKYLFMDFEDKNGRIKDITKLFPSRPLSLVWGPESGDIVFAVYKNHIDRLEIKSMSLYPKYIEDVKGCGISGRWLYVLGEDNSISRMTVDKEQAAVLFENKLFAADLFNSSFFYKIRVLENNISLLWGDKGDLIITAAPYDVARDGIIGMDFYGQKNQLVYWAKDAIWLADFERSDKIRTISVNRVMARAVYEKGRDISQCFRAHSGAHIIFRDKNEVSLLELAPDGGHHVEYIAQVKADSDCFYSERDECLYYLDKRGNLMKLGIIPKE